MRLDLVGMGGPAGCERRSCGRDNGPTSRLGDELRCLLPDADVRVHLQPAAPDLLDAGPHDLAQAFALGTPLVEHLQQLWRVDRPDLVHADCWVSGLAALRAARPLDVPVVAARWAGATDPWHPGSVPGDDVDLRLCLSADLVLARDEEDLARLHRHAVAQHVARLPVGIDLHCLGADVGTGVGTAGASRSAMQTGSHRGRRSRVPGRVASIVDRWTMSTLPTLLAAVDPRCGQRELVLLVPCATDEPAPARSLRSPVDSRLLSPLLPAISRATERGVRVTLEPARDGARRLALLGSVEQFVYTGDAAPSDRALVEAMAAGCLVITSGAGRLAGLVEDGATGFVTTGPDAEALSVALAAGSHPDVVEVVGRRAQAFVAERYAWPAVATQARHLYKTVLEGG